MTLFFPDNGGPNNNVKIAASNSQVGLTIGDTMTITAGDSFTIGAGSTSAIKIGPTTNFSIGSTVDLKLASSISYTYGFKAEYGAATASTSTSTKVKATDSYTIQAGVYTPVTQRLMLAEKYQVFVVLLGTIVSMGAIAVAVVGGLSSPPFVAVKGAASTDSAVPNSNDKDDPNNPNPITRYALALSLTTLGVFAAQWALTYFLAKSSEFLPVTNMLFNSTGITATAYTKAANEINIAITAANKATTEANLLTAAANKIVGAVQVPETPLITAVPSIESIMYASPSVDQPMLTHRVNQAPLTGTTLSPQLSELIINPNVIKLNSASFTGVNTTASTQIVMNSAAQSISLVSNAVPTSNSGSITISSATNIINPQGSTTLRSGMLPTAGSNLTLEETTSATLSCTNAGSTGSVVLEPTGANIGVTNGGYADFTPTGATLSGQTVNIIGTNITIGGALKINGSPAPLNSVLAEVAQQSASNFAAQQKLITDLTLANAKIELLEKGMLAAQIAAAAATEAVTKLEKSARTVV